MSYYIPSGNFAKAAQAAAAPVAAGTMGQFAGPAASIIATIMMLADEYENTKARDAAIQEQKQFHNIRRNITGTPASFVDPSNPQYNFNPSAANYVYPKYQEAPSGKKSVQNTAQNNKPAPSTKTQQSGGGGRTTTMPLTDTHDNGRDVTYDASVGTIRPYSKSYAEGDPTASAYMAGQEAAAQMAANAMQAPTEMTRGWAEGENAPEPVIKATDPFDQLVAAYGLNEGGTGQINPELMKQYYINRGTVPDMEAAEGLYNILRGAY